MEAPLSGRSTEELIDCSADKLITKQALLTSAFPICLDVSVHAAPEFYGNVVSITCCELVARNVVYPSVFVRM